MTDHVRLFVSFPEELRRKAESALGGKFDIRAFHDVILSNGEVPLPVLEELVDQYIESASERP